MVTAPLFALTVQQPFASAIIAGPKRVENRPWAPTRPLPMWIAIHAGVGSFHLLPADFDSWLDRIWPGRQGVPLPRGVFLGVARVDRVVRGRDMHQDPWYLGSPKCWILGAVRALPEPIPCKGAQGLWRVPDGAALSALRNLLEKP